MDIVTWVTACAVGVQAELFVPLGVREPCAAPVPPPAELTPAETAPRLDRWAPDIAAASRRFGVPPAWLRQVMRLESSGAAGATSDAGAMGLMQIMPRTYAELAARYRLGDNPYDPPANIAAGAAYLREMLDRFGTPGAFAAYNAGPGRMVEHLLRGRSLPAETQRYVARIMRAAPEAGTAIDWPIMALEDGAIPAADGRQPDTDTAVLVPPPRARTAAPWQRGPLAPGRSGALFVPLPSTARAGQGLGVEQESRGLRAGLDAVGVIDDRRGGALFVPLGSGEGPAPR
jgi:hypothetical protein